jgi:hypothetical protein
MIAVLGATRRPPARAKDIATATLSCLCQAGILHAASRVPPGLVHENDRRLSSLEADPPVDPWSCLIGLLYVASNNNFRRSPNPAYVRTESSRVRSKQHLGRVSAALKVVSSASGGTWCPRPV